MNAPVRHGRAGLPAATLARGRLPAGTMNKTEEAYARHLEGLKALGEIAWFGFEAWTLRLAKRCSYTPDFIVMRADGAMEAHEVKGHWTDDSRVKIKVAAAQHPLRFVAIRALPKKAGGGWEVEEF
ncbi:DUF1064 domain-containing protein [Methylobacterium sp. yr668]|uniref:DUF1064 domain-containing protein n=1 Tax=Methylobacterium sp. yr668 TaxID=1761801 RepID=UPI0008EAF9B9|nr:DUF1064 domain-containing protein [Methylobacterium sp. yr668]SFS58328.1 Protein of unknown function [Methylobacterium sp. yr668]